MPKRQKKTDIWEFAKIKSLVFQRHGGRNRITMGKAWEASGSWNRQRTLTVINKKLPSEGMSRTLEWYLPTRKHWMGDPALRRLTSNYYKTAVRRHSVAIQLCALPNGKWQVLVKTRRSIGDDHTLLVRMWNGAAVFKNSMIPSWKVWKSPSDPILEFHSEIRVLKSWKWLLHRSLAWLLRVELLTVTGGYQQQECQWMIHN